MEGLQTQMKNPTACNLISAISEIGTNWEEVTDQQQAELGRIKDSADRLRASIAEVEARLAAAKADLKKAREDRLPELVKLGRDLDSKANVLARIGAPRQWPSCIPRAILQDYNECCLIQNLSPKASVMLARRCLQAMIRDFFGVCCDRLLEETDEIRSQINPGTWSLIHEVRRMGNAGAHPTHPSELAAVEISDAIKAIRLIEHLFREWYLERDKRLAESNRPMLVRVEFNQREVRPTPGRPLAAG